MVKTCPYFLIGQSENLWDHIRGISLLFNYSKIYTQILQHSSMLISISKKIEHFENSTLSFEILIDNFNIFTNYVYSKSFALNPFREPLYTSDDFKDLRIWNKVDPNAKTINFLQIDKDVKMITVPTFENATKFWDSLNISDL